jgi:hypothetical protein
MIFRGANKYEITKIGAVCLAHPALDKDVTRKCETVTAVTALPAYSEAH